MTLSPFILIYLQQSVLLFAFLSIYTKLKGRGPKNLKTYSERIFSQYPSDSEEA